MRNDSVSIREKKPTNVAYFVRESVAMVIDHCDIGKRQIASNTVYVDTQFQINAAGTVLSWNERITVLHDEQEYFRMTVITESLALRMTKSGYVLCCTVATACPGSWNEPCNQPYP